MSAFNSLDAGFFNILAKIFVVIGTVLLVVAVKLFLDLRKATPKRIKLQMVTRPAKKRGRLQEASADLVYPEEATDVMSVTVSHAEANVNAGTETGSIEKQESVTAELSVSAEEENTEVLKEERDSSFHITKRMAYYAASGEWNAAYSEHPSSPETEA